MEELKKKILAWADERGLLNPANSNAQIVKLGEEIAEFVFAKNEEETKDALGDIAVVLTIIAEQRNINLIADKNQNSLQNIFILICKYNNNEAVFKEMLYWLWGALYREAENKGFTLYECIEHAYEQIKERQGQLVNGTFIKNS